MPRTPIQEIDGRTWYNRFRRAVHKFFDWEGVAKTGEITEVWTEAMEHFHRAMGFELRHKGKGKGELGNIDVTVFDKLHSEAQIAIELQQAKGGVMKKDVPKLACSNAKLKILLTRVYSSEIENLKKTIFDFWRKRSERVQNDDFLLLFVVTSPAGNGNVNFVQIEPYLSEQSKEWVKLKTRLI